MGRDLVLNPPQAGDPLNYFVYPYVEVNGKKWENVSNHFSFSRRRSRQHVCVGPVVIHREFNMGVPQVRAVLFGADLGLRRFTVGAHPIATLANKWVGRFTICGW